MTGYTEKPRSKWGAILAGVPRSEPAPPPEEADNVVHLKQLNLDDRARRIRELDQKLMALAIDLDRKAREFNSMRDELMRERAGLVEALKHENIKSEYVHTPPEIEMLDRS